MNEFPEYLYVKSAEDVEKFSDIFYERQKGYIRKDIHDHILSHKPSEFFSIDHYTRRDENPWELKTCKKILHDLSQELRNMGWNVSMVYGDTCIFIYQGDEPEQLKMLGQTFTEI